MKLIVLVAFCLALTSCDRQDESNAPTDTEPSGIEIWLVDNDALTEQLDVHAELRNVPLDDFPLEIRLVCDEDVLEWNWNEQSVLISSAAVERFPRRGERDLLEAIFVLKLNGVPLYFGAMTFRHSSDSQAFPAILVDSLPVRPVEHPHRISIDKCYPARMFDISPDDDTRLSRDLLRYLRSTSRLKSQ